jgi:small-conductance mechanosensitive channel
MDEWVERAIIAGAVLLGTLIVARLVDRWIEHHLSLTPEVRTRYRVVRRSAVAVVLTVGLLSALLVIPQVRAVAGSILASGAVIALIIGLAAQTTLSNWVAGVLIAITQPLRLGDSVTVVNASGTVDEIGLTYTIIRGSDGSRYFVPNAKLASDTIRNATIASSEHLAAVSVPVPLTADLDRVLSELVEEARRAPEAVSEKEPTATVSQLEATGAVVTVEAWARSAAQAGELASRLRIQLTDRLRRDGIYG